MMKELLVLFMALVLFTFSVIAGTIIIEGNDDRGEPPCLVGGGNLVIDVYAEGLLNVAAIQSSFDFLQNSSNFNSLFQISKDEGNPKYLNFDYQMIDLGPSIPLEIFPIYTSERNTAGFMLFVGSMYFSTKTLLYSVTYEYDVQVVGTYIVDINSSLTSIGDSDANSISYAVTSGSVTISKLGDFDGDGNIGWVDLSIFVSQWLRTDCNIPDWCEGADIDRSSNVDFIDFASFATNWLLTTTK